MEMGGGGGRERESKRKKRQRETAMLRGTKLSGNLYEQRCGYCVLHGAVCVFLSSLISTLRSLSATVSCSAL